MKKKTVYSENDLVLPLDFEPVKVLENPIDMKEQLQMKSKPKKSGRNQQKLNKLIHQIEKLEKEIEDTNALATELNLIYSNKIEPIETDLGHAYFKFAQFIENYAAKFKLTNRQQFDVEEIIVNLCDEALRYIEPDEQQEALYNKYNEFSYRDTKEEQKQFLLDQFRSMMEDEIGIELDDLNFDISDDAELRKFGERLNEKFLQKRLKEADEALTNKKTAHQIKQEQEQQLREALATKSLRSIYISLAKMLHPDTEPDEALKLEKSELMKKVTVAYNDKDLASLLKLEMEWVHRTTENFELLSDDVLTLYIQVLNEQVQGLIDELYFIKINPAYSKIFEWLDYSNSDAHEFINRYKGELIDELEKISMHQRIFENQPVKKSVLIKYLKEIKQDAYDDDDDDYFEA